MPDWCGIRLTSLLGIDYPIIQGPPSSRGIALFSGGWGPPDSNLRVACETTGII